MRRLFLTGPPQSNIAYYRERDATPDERYVWAEVLTDSLEKIDGVWKAKRVPTYSITIYRNKRGKIGEVSYAPKTRTRDPLPARTVTRLVKEAIGA